MPWDETADYIRSGHRDLSEFSEGSLRTVTLSEEEGIEAIIGKPVGKDATEVQSYLFSRAKGWTLDKAKGWFKAHVESEGRIRFIVECVKPVLAEKAVKIKGILAPPRVSLNRNIYLPEELAKGHGRVLPLYWEHDYSKSSVGLIKLNWNNHLQRLEYEAEVTDEEKAEMVRGGLVKNLSLGAEYEYQQFLSGYKVPHNLNFYEASLTTSPGIPESSIMVIEHVTQTDSAEAGSGVTSPSNGDVQGRGEVTYSQVRPVTEAELSKACINDPSNTSFIVKEFEGGMNEDERDALGRLDQRKLSSELMAGQRLLKHAEELGVGQAVWGERRMSEESKQQTREIRGDTGMQHAPSVNVTVNIPPEVFQEQVKILGQIKEAVEVKRELKPTALIPDEKRTLEAQGKLRRESIFKKYILNPSGPIKGVVEALTDASAADAQGQLWLPDIVHLPRTIAASLRRFTDFKEVAKGADRVHWVTITEPTWDVFSSGIARSDSAQTIAKKSATPLTRVSGQSLDYDVIESSTPDLVEALDEAFVRSAVVDQDCRLLLVLNGNDDDLNCSTVIYGGNAPSKASIDSADTISEEVFTKALRKLQEQGFDTSPGNIIVVLHPKQYMNLLQSSDVKTAMQYGTMGTLEDGVVNRLYGVDIVVSDQVPTTTGSGGITVYKTFFFVKNKAIGYASSRNLLIESERDTKKQRLELTASYRDAEIIKDVCAVIKVLTA